MFVPQSERQDLNLQLSIHQSMEKNEKIALPVSRAPSQCVMRTVYDRILNFPPTNTK